MDIHKIYSNLVKQYDKLTDEEKKAITIYSSALFYHINEISSIPNFENMDYIEILNEINNKEEFINRIIFFEKYISNPSNIFLKYLVFGKIDYDNIENFINQMKEVYKIIDNTKEKIILEEDITVYRGCNYNENEYEISKSNLISTTLDIETTKQFLFKNDKKNKLYIINLKKGIPILVNPLSIKNIYDSKASYLKSQEPQRVKITDDLSENQLEVILFKDMIELNIDETIKKDKDNLEIEKLTATKKEKTEEKIESNTKK